jgi:hypothetical protein
LAERHHFGLYLGDTAGGNEHIHFGVPSIPAGAMETPKIVEGAEVRPLQRGDFGGDAAEEFGIGRTVKEGEVQIFGVGAFGEEGTVEFALGAAVAASEPIGMNEGGKVGFFERGLRTELGAIVGDYALIGFAVFAGEKDGIGVEAVLQGIKAGAGFVFGGARAVGFLRVGAVRGNWGWGGHGTPFRVQK